LEKSGFPFAFEDRSRTEPFFVWIITLPAETNIEYRFARALLADAGVDCDGFTAKAMVDLQNDRHSNAVKHGGFRFADPNTWERLPCLPITRAIQLQDPLEITTDAQV
jgi:hypothetical protein